LTAKLARRFKVPVTNQKNLEEPLTAAGVPYCPGGAILNNGPAYSPATNLVYINSQDWCNIGFKRPAKYIAGIQYNGGSGRRDPLDESFGWTSAIDATSGDIKWRYRSPQGIPMLGAVTPTAGNVLFTGDTAGYFLVFNATSGDVLYRFNTGWRTGRRCRDVHGERQAIRRGDVRQHVVPSVQGGGCCDGADIRIVRRNGSATERNRPEKRTACELAQAVVQSPRSYRYL